MVTRLPATAATAAAMFTNGGQMATSAWLEPATRGTNFSKKAVVSAGVLYIFQLPAMRGVRISSMLSRSGARSLESSPARPAP